MNGFGEHSALDFRFYFPDRIAHSTVKSSELTRREMQSGQGIEDSVGGRKGSLSTPPQKITSERPRPPPPPPGQVGRDRAERNWKEGESLGLGSRKRYKTFIASCLFLY